MRGLILISKGFEESEAIITIDMLRRAQITIDLVSIDKDLTVLSSHNIQIVCDYKVSQINLNDYDFLVIPGGKAVFDTHLFSLTVKSIVEYFMNQQKLVATICAAPMVLGKYKYLKNKQYTCFPGCENTEFEGIYLNNQNVVTTNNEA